MPINKKILGVEITGQDADTVCKSIITAESMGVKAAWITTGSAPGMEALTLFAHIAGHTNSILLGSAITLTFPTHPIIVAQQSAIVAGLAEGRFRLGIGPGSPTGIKDSFGINFRKPLGHLNEYIRITKSLLQTGSVAFDGDYYSAHGNIPHPVNVPVMISALGPRSFELSGRESDGAISWLCPSEYMSTIALTNITNGANEANREVPPIVAHLPICFSNDLTLVRKAMMKRFGYMASSPVYKSVFNAMGFPEIDDGVCTPEMVNATVAWGTNNQIGDRIMAMLSSGMSELIISDLPVSNNDKGSPIETFRLVADLSQ